MPRFPKRLLALGGLAAAGVAAMRRKQAAAGSSPAPPPPGPAASGPTPSAAQAAAAVPEPPIAPPPVETPGPSVTPPAQPESDTERAERAEATTPDPEILRRQAGGPIDELVEAETAAAAAEARGIGGPGVEDAPGDPAMEAVYEAGGGEQEGFELAERDLIDNATHGGGHGDPSRDAFTPELESDISTARYGEADEEKISEVVEDPDPESSPDDPGAGPGITHER
jgi:hypothetical protein